MITEYTDPNPYATGTVLDLCADINGDTEFHTCLTNHREELFKVLKQYSSNSDEQVDLILSLVRKIHPPIKDVPLPPFFKTYVETVKTLYKFSTISVHRALGL